MHGAPGDDGGAGVSTTIRRGSLQHVLLQSLVGKTSGRKRVDGGLESENGTASLCFWPIRLLSLTTSFVFHLIDGAS